MSCSSLCIRLLWLVTAMLKFINKWIHHITKAQDILQNISQSKCNSGVSLLVSHLCLIWNLLFSGGFSWQFWNQNSDQKSSVLLIQILIKIKKEANVDSREQRIFGQNFGFRISKKIRQKRINSNSNKDERQGRKPRYCICFVELFEEYLVPL